MEDKINFIKENRDYSTDMPIWLLLVLLIGTLGFYSCYWAYSNIRMLNHIKKSDISPWVGIFFGIPFVPYYIFYKILDLNYNNKFLNHIVALFLTIVVYYFLQFGYLEAPLCVIGLVTLLPELIIQREINKFIKRHKI